MAVAQLSKACLGCGIQFIGHAKRGSQPSYCSRKCNRRFYSRPVHVRICDYCKIEYKTTHAKQRRCSRECRNRTLETRSCFICGKTFAPYSSKVQCCSARCGREKSRRTRAKTYDCKNCGVRFQPKSSERVTFCSRGCSETFRSAGARERERERGRFQDEKRNSKRCLLCGKPSDGRKHCQSAECRFTLYRQYYEQYWKRHQESREFVSKRCAHCGREFTVNYHAERMYCPDRRCGEAAGHRARRARKRGAVRTPYSPVEILKRDGWRCLLCHRAINRKAKVPHPKSGVVDHIVPLARGGEDTPRNVQAAHFLCNSKKAAEILGQLRLL